MTPCTKDYHIFEFWGTDKVTGGIPKGWKCNCGEKKYKEEENKQRAINELFSSLLQKEREAGKEIIICAAIKLKDGRIFRGHRHTDCLRVAKMVAVNVSVIYGSEQGFITSKNRFVEREEAHKIHFGKEGILYSEDLY